MSGQIGVYQWFCRNIKHQHFILATVHSECFLIWQDDIISAYQKTNDHQVIFTRDDAHMK